MKIDELAVGQKITILSVYEQKNMEFETTIQETNNRMHFVLAEPIYRNDKLLSFRAKGLKTHIIVTFPNEKPLVFRNVIIDTLGKEDGTFSYVISTVGESVIFNRRSCFRFEITLNAVMMISPSKDTHDVIIRDISENGFSFVFLKDEKQCGINQLVHFVLNDFIEEISEKFSFHIFGTVVRQETLENGCIVYGCKMVNKNSGLNGYIMKKERIRLQRQRGTK